MNTTYKIKTRESYLVVQDLGHEILIYDLKINKAFCLTETAAIVWRLCDGEKTVAEISKIMSEKLNSPVTEDFVWLAIDELNRENLLADPENIKNRFEGNSRREMITKVGLATMIAFPLITSLVAPTAAQAQSGNCIRSGQELCISPQQNNQVCFDAVDTAAIGQCCVGTVIAYTFNRSACCGVCGTPAP